MIYFSRMLKAGFTPIKYATEAELNLAPKCAKFCCKVLDLNVDLSMDFTVVCCSRHMYRFHGLCGISVGEMRQLIFSFWVTA